jgi:hydroxylamine reductase (hybrid-cluster protein)
LTIASRWRLIYRRCASRCSPTQSTLQGVVPPVTGSPLVVKVLTETAKELHGGYFIVELDPKLAAQKLVAALRERRAGLEI